jgi:hypothetical protein
MCFDDYNKILVNEVSFSQLGAAFDSIRTASPRVVEARSTYWAEGSANAQVDLNLRN